MTPISNNRARLRGPIRIAPITPKLLVSVRDRSEIADALAAGADLIDLKEPRRGPLAPADLDLWLHAASLWTDRSLGPPYLSAALGEQSDAVRVARGLPAEFAFAKVGPSHCDGAERILDLWAEIRQLLDHRIELVAVAYADYRSARCIHPNAIFQLAADAGIQRCLIDTYIKDGQSTLQHLGIDGLTQLGSMAREAGLWWTLAGSIRLACVAELRQHDLVPDCFGVRGDVCQRGRTGTLSSDRIGLWKKSLASLEGA